MDTTGLSTRERRRRGYCLTCRTARPVRLHAFWTTLCTAPAAGRRHVAHERHCCLTCGLRLLRGQDPRVTLQFGRRLRHLVPIENVRLMFLARLPRTACLLLQRLGRAVACAAVLAAAIAAELASRGVL